MLSIENLIELEADESCGHNCGGCDGRDYSASNELGLELINFRNMIVSGPHICKMGDHVHVKVSVIILHIGSKSPKEDKLTFSNTK